MNNILELINSDNKINIINEKIYCDDKNHIIKIIINLI